MKPSDSPGGYHSRRAVSGQAPGGLALMDENRLKRR
ncbi:hypothetical protein GGE65_005062 [Skermanella aerolata]